MTSNTERSNWFRDYFEEGCLCLHDRLPEHGNVLAFAPKEWSDFEAIKYYEQNCTCTRNYIANDPEGFQE